MPSINAGGIEYKFPDSINLGGNGEDKTPKVPMVTPEDADKAGDEADDLMRPRDPENARRWGEMTSKLQGDHRERALGQDLEYLRGVNPIRENNRDNQLDRTIKLSDNHTRNTIKIMQPSIDLESKALDGLNSRYNSGLEFGRDRLASIERMHGQSIGATNQANTLSMLGRLVSVGGLLAALS